MREGKTRSMKPCSHRAACSYRCSCDRRSRVSIIVRIYIDNAIMVRDYCVALSEARYMTRHSSVDDVPDSPGYGPIAMDNLWELTDRAIQVLSSAQRHLSWDDPGYRELFPLIEALLHVARYTVALRECYLTPGA